MTVVAHETGYIHILFPTATIDPAAYKNCHQIAPLPADAPHPQIPTLCACSTELQKCFQVRWRNFGVDRYIAGEAS